MKWSENQINAIKYNKKSNVIISAGAGSGKTAVLTERVYELVKQGVPLSRMLVLTFSNAAAAEMKSRIRKKLLADEETKVFASEVDSAHIETFDAFNMFLVKKFAFDLGLPISIELFDNSLASIKRKSYIDQVIEEHLKNNDKTLKKMIKTFCVKNVSVICGIIENVLALADIETNKNEFYDTYIDKFYNDKFIDELINNRFKDEISTINQLKIQAQMLDSEVDSTNLLNYFALFDDCKNLDDVTYLVRFQNIPGKTGGNKDDKPRRDAINNVFKQYLKTDFGSIKEIKQDFFDKKVFAEKIVELAKEVEDKLFALKQKYNRLTFGDFARYAVLILKDEFKKQEVRNSFDYVMVDEYQDTSDIQEELIKEIGNNNVYMVGDVKQCIYAFRNANPKNFQDKYDAYGQNNGGEKIDLNKSFRSRRPIVDAVNDMFGQIFDKCINPINYKDGHNFEFGAKDTDKVYEEGIKYGVKVLNYTPDDRNAYDHEAELIAHDIRNKLNSHYKVYRRSSNSMEDATFKDFAILCRGTTHYDSYRKAFAEHGIPLNVIKEDDFTTSDINYSLKNLLTLFSLLVNNVDYSNNKLAHSFASVARSFLVEMDDETLYKTISGKLYDFTSIFEKMMPIVHDYKYGSLSIIFNKLLGAFDIYEAIVRLGDYEKNSLKIETLANSIKQMDQMGFTLDELVNYFDELIHRGETIGVDSSDLNKDAVILMTMHKSKGLEFAVCYLPEFVARFNTKSSSSSFNATKDFGLIVPNYGINANCSLPLTCFKRKVIQSSFEEDLRLLYVAITRAKEQAIILNSSSGKEKFLIDASYATSFKDLLDFYGFNDKYSSDEFLETSNCLSVKNNTDKVGVSIKQINVPSDVVVRKKASKENEDGSEIQELLEFGSKIHYLLEVTDFKTKDTSFITSPKYKKYVNNVLNCGLFDDINNAIILHEYKFIDEKNGVNGTIDALVVRDDRIEIIDFKLKKLDDENYNRQLNVYYDYIVQISNNKPIKMYLISSITGEVREVGKN